MLEDGRPSPEERLSIQDLKGSIHVVTQVLYDSESTDIQWNDMISLYQLVIEHVEYVWAMMPDFYGH
jgi:hypothetical protein